MSLVRLELESPYDVISLDGVETSGYGVQVRSGVTGLGLPPKSVQWLEGAGDGAIARGWRTLARDIDLPLQVVGATREDLKAYLSQLASLLGTNHDHVVHEGVLTLNFYDESGKWTCPVEHVGGGDYVYGTDTIGVHECTLVITLRAGNPYFVAESSVIESFYQVTGGGYP